MSDDIASTIDIASDEQLVVFLYAIHATVVDRTVHAYMRLSIEDAADDLNRAIRALGQEADAYQLAELEASHFELATDLKFLRDAFRADLMTLCPAALTTVERTLDKAKALIDKGAKNATSRAPL